MFKNVTLHPDRRVGILNDNQRESQRLFQSATKHFFTNYTLDFLKPYA